MAILSLIRFRNLSPNQCAPLLLKENNYSLCNSYDELTNLTRDDRYKRYKRFFANKLWDRQTLSESPAILFLKCGHAESKTTHHIIFEIVKRTRGLFLKRPETFRAHFGCHTQFPLHPRNAEVLKSLNLAILLVFVTLKDVKGSAF